MVTCLDGSNDGRCLGFDDRDPAAIEVDDPQVSSADGETRALTRLERDRGCFVATLVERDDAVGQQHPDHTIELDEHRLTAG